MPENSSGKKPAVLTVGTPQCALACAFLGAVIAVLFLTIGFWKTLFIALFVFAGLFVGGVRDKSECVRSATEAVLPRKEVKVYQAQERKPVPQAEPADEAEEAVEAEEAEEAEEEDGETEEEDPEDTEAEEEEDTEDSEEDEDEAEDEDADRKAGEEA